MTALLIVLAVVAVLAVLAVPAVHLYHQGARARQTIQNDAALTALTRERNAARRSRDATVDAVADMVDLIDKWLAEEAADIGRAVLATNSYPGRLQALQDALDEAEGDCAQLRAFIAEIGLEGMGADPDDGPVFHGHQQYRKEEDVEL